MTEKVIASVSFSRRLILLLAAFSVSSGLQVSVLMARSISGVTRHLALETDGLAKDDF